MKNKIIICYSETLNSFLLFSRIINERPQDIECMIKFPAVPRNPLNEKKFISYVNNKISSVSLYYLFFNFFVLYFYSFLTFIFQKQLRNLSKEKRIPVYNHTFLDKKFHDFISANKTKYIFYSAPNIVKKESVPEDLVGLISYHCAPLPEYRGSSNYFWMMKNKEKEVHSTMFYIDEGIDEGNILRRGEKVSIKKKMTVFQLWKKLRLTAHSNFNIIMDMISDSKVIESTKQPNIKSSARSFPSKEDGEKIQKMGHHIFSLRDLIYIFKSSKLLYLEGEK